MTTNGITSQLIDIQKYWGVTGYYCKKCGEVTPLEEIQPYTMAQKYGIRCNDCGYFLAWLKQSKVLRIFKSVGEGMVEIEKIDRDWLRWALRINHTEFRKKINIEAAQRRIKSHNMDPLPDYYETPKDKKIVKARKLMAGHLLNEQRISLLLSEVQDDILANWGVWDSATMSYHEKKINYFKRKLKSLSKKIATGSS